MAEEHIPTPEDKIASEPEGRKETIGSFVENILKKAPEESVHFLSVIKEIKDFSEYQCELLKYVDASLRIGHEVYFYSSLSEKQNKEERYDLDVKLRPFGVSVFLEANQEYDMDGNKTSVWYRLSARID